VLINDQPKRWYYDLAIGGLMYLSTLYFASNAVLLFVLALIVFSDLRSKFKSDFVLVWIFALLALVNLLLHLDAFDSSRHGSAPAVVLIALMATLSPGIRMPAFKVFVLLTCGEIAVGAYEYAIGQVALTEAQAAMANQELATESLLLYDNRVFGLSANSSIFAEKIFLSLLLVVAVPDMFKFRAVPLLFIAAGLFFSFNRTAILSTLIFLVLLATACRMNWRTLVLGAGVTVAVGAALAINIDSLVLQFARGGSELSHSELSRLYFWQKALGLLSQNPLLGNGSLTFRVEDFVTGMPQHTHNSFLMLFATHGFLVSLPLVVYILLRVRASNWRVLVAIFSFSLTQYFIFWNLSVPDIVFFYFLGRQLPLLKVRAKESTATSGIVPMGATS
jgi:O-antigen ligase